MESPRSRPPRPSDRSKAGRKGQGFNGCHESAGPGLGRIGNQSMSTRAKDAAQAITALLVLAPNEAAARAIAAGLVSPQMLQLFDRQAAVLRARKMLDNHIHPHEMAYRLAGRYAISIKTAQRRIKAALAMGRR